MLRLFFYFYFIIYYCIGEWVILVFKFKYCYCPIYVWTVVFINLLLIYALIGSSANQSVNEGKLVFSVPSRKSELESYIYQDCFFEVSGLKSGLNLLSFLFVKCVIDVSLSSGGFRFKHPIQDSCLC